MIEGYLRRVVEPEGGRHGGVMIEVPGKGERFIRMNVIAAYRMLTAIGTKRKVRLIRRSTVVMDMSGKVLWANGMNGGKGGMK